MAEVKTVGVLGAGLMGHGIAQVAAQAGYDVVLREVDDDRLAKGVGKIEKQLARAVEKGKLEQADADAARGRIAATTHYGELSGCDLVIEAITEDLALKLEMWRQLDEIVKPDAWFATNTSSLAVVDQAAATSRPERFLGLHFFNPAQVMPLVEVIRAVTTSDEAFQAGLDFGAKLGKKTVQTRDSAGFIVNRLLVPYLLDAIVKPEAWFATNTSSLPVVDQAAATSRPERFLGVHFFNPAQVMPLVEVIRAVTTSDEAFQTGLEFGAKLGKKTVKTRDSAGFIVNRLLVPYMLDAIRAYEEGVGSIEQIDAAMKAGANHPMGPFTLLDFVGLDTTKSIADIMFDEYREKRFAAPPTLRKMVAAGWYGNKSGRGFYDHSGETPVAVDPGL